MGDRKEEADLHQPRRSGVALASTAMGDRKASMQNLSLLASFVVALASTAMGDRKVPIRSVADNFGGSVALASTAMGDRKG